MRTVREHGSAITSVHVKETVLMVKNENENRIDYVPDRANTRLARAPQSFWLREILQAQRKAISEGKTEFIDSCSLMQYFGKCSGLLAVIDEPFVAILQHPDIGFRDGNGVYEGCSCIAGEKKQVTANG